MSTFGLQAAQYERTSALARKIARLVAQIETGTQASLQTRLQLAPIMERLGELLRPHSVVHVSAQDSLTFPAGTLRRLRSQQTSHGDLADVIPGVVVRLKDIEVPVPDEDMRVLRDVAGTVDREAAAARSRMLRS